MPERVLRAGFRGYERLVEWRSDADAELELAGELPLPPARLRVLVVLSADPRFFLESGRAQAAFVGKLLERNGVELSELDSILDLGCGCGRLLRWWGELDGPRLCGCDYNPELAAWCARNLPFVDARANTLEPPLPFADRKPFGLIHALSVFTHLPEDLGRRWLDEIRCALAPGGLFVFTVGGERYSEKLEGADLEAFRRGELVTHFDEVAGTNLQAAYHPRAYVESRMLDGFELLEAVTSATPMGLGQDVYLARRTD